MDCERARIAITERALEGPGSRCDEALDAHLAACRPCRAAWERERLLLAAIDLGLRAGATTQPSPDLEARFRARVAAETGRPKLRLGPWLTAATAAALLLAVIAQVSRQTTGREIAVVGRALSTQVAATPPAVPAARPSAVAVAVPAEAERPRPASPTRRPVARRSGRERPPAAAVPPGQLEAAVDLIRISRSARIAPAQCFQLTPGVDPPAIQLAAISIPPVEVAELEPPSLRPLTELDFPSN